MCKEKNDIEESSFKGCSTNDCSGPGEQPGETPEQSLERKQLARNMSRIRHKIVVLSGKGGVGKSTVAANLAVTFQSMGKKVGLLDVDIHGPSIPRLLNIYNAKPISDGNMIQPITTPAGMKLMSIGFLLKDEKDAVIWRGPMKMGVIKQFLTEVEWGDLDYLVIDSPPGTGDEPLSVCQLIPDAQAVVVTAPQDLAIIDVRKCITFCSQVKLEVLGVIENFSGFVCPNCGKRTGLFKSGGGERLAKEMLVPFLGRLPIDPCVVEASDAGVSFIEDYPDSEVSKVFRTMVKNLLDSTARSQTDKKLYSDKKGETEKVKVGNMKIAIPLAQGKLAMHFGHCEEFALLEVDSDKKEVLNSETLVPPPHEPGALPKWLHEMGASVIISGGMGSRAQDIFARNGIEVVVGAQVEEPRKIALAYLDGSLKAGENVCDH